MHADATSTLRGRERAAVSPTDTLISTLYLGRGRARGAGARPAPGGGSPVLIIHSRRCKLSAKSAVSSGGIAGTHPTGNLITSDISSRGESGRERGRRRRGFARSHSLPNRRPDRWHRVEFGSPFCHGAAIIVAPPKLNRNISGHVPFEFGGRSHPPFHDCPPCFTCAIKTLQMKHNTQDLSRCYVLS